MVVSASIDACNNPGRRGDSPITALSEVELRWLEYARHVVAPTPSHISKCVAAHGVHDRLDASTTLRWPGYIGRRYEPGVGALCVLQVHRDVNAASERVDPAYNVAYVKSTTAFRDWQLSETDFLEASRKAYEYWIPRWDRWEKIFHYLIEEALDLHVDQIAWANLAKCQVSTEDSPETAIAVCQQDYPIRKLVEAIRPCVVLIARSRKTDAEPPEEQWGESRVYRFNFRNGSLGGKTPLHAWAPRMAQAARHCAGKDRQR